VAGSPGDGARAGVVGAIGIAGMAGEAGVVVAVVIAGVAGRCLGGGAGVWLQTVNSDRRVLASDVQAEVLWSPLQDFVGPAVGLRQWL